ncbi:MAG: phytanoyl-CoA dioxygenase family protein [Gammaproteobacteria bacterium]
MSGINLPLAPQQVEAFKQDGYLILEGFVDIDEYVLPIQKAIYEIIGLLISKYNVEISRTPFSPETFDSGFLELIKINRKWGGEVYDAIKQIPQFVRLTSSAHYQNLFSQLRETEMPGFAAGGYGIRIDVPGERRFEAPWHQEYPAQFRSADGIVFWSPLIPMSAELGPVKIYKGSHKEGMIRVHTDEVDGQSGAYALRLENEAELGSSYQLVSPLLKPGDLILIDFFTVHASGQNSSDRARWSMQSRFFNFMDPTGLKISWKGSFSSGLTIADVHPELVI